MAGTINVLKLPGPDQNATGSETILDQLGGNGPAETVHPALSRRHGGSTRGAVVFVLHTAPLPLLPLMPLPAYFIPSKTSKQHLNSAREQRETFLQAHMDEDRADSCPQRLDWSFEIIMGLM